VLFTSTVKMETYRPVSLHRSAMLKTEYELIWTLERGVCVCV